MTIINSEVITDTTDPRIANSTSRFITKGLGLEVDWENVIKEVVILAKDNNKDLETTVGSIINKPYRVKLLPVFTSTWDDNSKTHIINDYPVSKTNIDFIQRIRNMRHNMPDTELCRLLSHALAWNYCVQKQHPIIIIESGNILQTSEQIHLPRNSIINLTNSPLKQINENWHSFQGVECYSVDQFVSRQLLEYLYSQGIRDQLTTMIRDDLFCIV